MLTRNRNCRKGNFSLTQSHKGRKEGQNPCVSHQVAKKARKSAADDFFGLWPTHHFFFRSSLRPLRLCVRTAFDFEACDLICHTLAVSVPPERELDLS